MRQLKEDNRKKN